MEVVDDTTVKQEKAKNQEETETEAAQNTQRGVRRFQEFEFLEENAMGHLANSRESVSCYLVFGFLVF